MTDRRYVVRVAPRFVGTARLEEWLNYHTERGYELVAFHDGVAIFAVPAR